MNTHADPVTLAARLDQIAFEVAAFLADRQLPDGDLPAKNYYGRAFSVLTWAQYGNRFLDNMNRAVQNIAREQSLPLPLKYHFEFNRYALLKARELSPSIPAIDAALGPERYTGTRVANWMLLRIYCRFHSNHVVSRCLGRAELVAARLWFADPSGMIEDQRGAYTMQYHAFCVALLGEILSHQTPQSTAVSRWFKQSIDALALLVLPGGQCNYVGRGSLQSFGYAAAILAFVRAYTVFGNEYYLEKAEAVLGYVKLFQRSDGSFPLVLSGAPEGDPSRFDLMNPLYAGWWSYNNFYDYLPFTAALLGLSKKLLLQRPSCREYSVVTLLGLRRMGKAMVLIHKDRYSAFIALPNKRVWASSLPIPFLAVNGKYPLPCYGGEQHQASLYSEYALPLPIIETESKGEILLAGADYAWSNDDSFMGSTSYVRHERQFTFDENKIVVRDSISWDACLSVQKVRAPRLLIRTDTAKQIKETCLQLDGLTIEFDGPIEDEQSVLYGPQGSLTAWVRQNLPIGAGLEQRHVVCEMSFVL